MTERKLFDLVMLIGETIVENSGEISRATETMERLAAFYELHDFSCFLLSTGVFASATIEGTHLAAKIRYIPISPEYLCRLDAINHLSRKIVAGDFTPEEARNRVYEIRKMRVISKEWLAFFTGLGSACFTYLLGVGLSDSLFAIPAGILASLFTDYFDKHTKMSKIMVNIASGALVAIYATLVYQVGLAKNLDGVLIGSIVPFLPGLSFTNSVRLFFSDDYLSGLIRLLDTLLMAAGVAFGVVVTSQFLQLLF